MEVDKRRLEFFLAQYVEAQHLGDFAVERVLEDELQPCQALGIAGGLSR